jgi:co-chaperonin GroES (HSP10)
LNKTAVQEMTEATKKAWNDSWPPANQVFPNPSGLTPLGHAVLVKPYQPEVKSGTIVIPDQVRQSMQSVDQRAIVIAVGPSAWEHETRARAKPGDKVLVTKFAGYLTNQTEDGEEYRIVNDRDIFCRIDWDM